MDAEFRLAYGFRDELAAIVGARHTSLVSASGHSFNGLAQLDTQMVGANLARTNSSFFASSSSTSLCIGVGFCFLATLKRQFWPQYTHWLVR